MWIPLTPLALTLVAVVLAPLRAQADQLVAKLGEAKVAPRVMAELVAMGEPALPVLLRAVVSRSGRPTPVGFEGERGRQIPPALLRRVRCLEVLRRMGGAAQSALPALFEAVAGEREVWAGNLVETITYLTPIDARGQPTGLSRQDGRIWRATARGCLNQINSVHAPVLSVVEGPSGWRVRRAPRSVLSRFKATLSPLWVISKMRETIEYDSEYSIYRWELIAAHARRVGAKGVSPHVLQEIHTRLARYYPPDNSVVAATRRGLADKINPRYLDSLATALIATRPKACAVAHVHWLETGTPPQRHTAAVALGMLGAKAETAVVWLIEAAQFGRPALAREAIVALGLIGPGAASALPVLRALARSEHKPEQSALAGAALRLIERG